MKSSGSVLKCFRSATCCFDLAGVCLSVDQEPRQPHRISFDFIVCFRASSSLSLLTGSIRRRAIIDLT